MNRIVRVRYPIDRLPEDLRVGLPEHGWVRIELNPDDGTNTAPISGLVGSGRNVHGNLETVLSAIEAIRQDR